MKRILIGLFIAMLSISLYAREKTDANIIGHVVSGTEHLPFASVYIKGTTIGVSTDVTGHYRMLNLPIGEFSIVAKVVGFKLKEKQINIKRGETLELNFDLEEDVLGLDEIVITGDRNEMHRSESPVIVNALPAKFLNSVQAVTLGEGLNYCSGLRLENNCQNCGFTQLRMNGMEGAYSQILINSRPVFSGLAGVYGLELIPTNMIERIEVVRGGGSALYGSNAIAGTVNIILKDPLINSYEVGYNLGFTGNNDPALDQSFNVNVSLVSDDHKSGITLYAFNRNREEYDANGDEFTELSNIYNTTFGTRFFHTIGIKSKIDVDFFAISEKRRGGNNFDLPYHESDITEAVEHNIKSGSINYDRFLGPQKKLSVYLAVQDVDRDSYYGSGEPENYGNTKSFTYVGGASFKAQFDQSNLVFGIENQAESLEDTKLGYSKPSIISGELNKTKFPSLLVADQTSNIIGSYVQYDYKFNDFKFALGFRLDHYSINNEVLNQNINGNVFSPRINILYDLGEHLQLRSSYSKGYRAPQIFDEDLHISSSKSRRVTIENAPNLEQESSHSFMGSIDFHPITSIGEIEFLLEFFYTKLENPFANEYGEPDQNGNVVYIRKNDEGGAIVKGINTEITYVPSPKINFIAGFTIQSSKFNEIQLDFGDKKFHRSPENYGFLNLLWIPNKKWEFSITGNYTGSMIVPYFGPELPNPEEGELRNTKKFWDMGLKLSKRIRLNGTSLEIFTGIKNIFNSYQDDFDSGSERDPAYIYGPASPRMIYFGLKLGSITK